MVAVENVHTIYVKLENRPGTLARAAKALGDHRVNVDAISLETVGNGGFARVVTSKPREALDALRSAGIESYESPAIVATLANRPGELAHATSELAASGINVEGVITTPDGRLVLRTSDNERTAQILRKL
jgi:hypothetical protein